MSKNGNSLRLIVLYLLTLVHSSKAAIVNVTKAQNANGGRGGRSFPRGLLLLAPCSVAGT